MDNKIEELEEQLEELRAKVNELEQALSLAKLAEWPQEGDRYWFVTSDGVVSSDLWDNDSTDAGRAEIGNVFRTEEEADFEVQRLRVIAELKKFAMSREEVYAARRNYPVYCMCLCGDLITSDNHIRDRYALLYFKDNSILQEAVKSVGEGKIKKYYFGIED